MLLSYDSPAIQFTHLKYTVQGAPGWLSQKHVPQSWAHEFKPHMGCRDHVNKFKNQKKKKKKNTVQGLSCASITITNFRTFL